MTILDKFGKLNEKHGAWLMVWLAVIVIGILSWKIPSTLEGMSYLSAVGDSFGLRVVKLAVFDMHVLGVLYFYGGNTWNIVQLCKTKPVSTAIMLAAIFVGSAMMLM
jgi:hypothetical protein